MRKLNNLILAQNKLFVGQNNSIQVILTFIWYSIFLWKTIVSQNRNDHNNLCRILYLSLKWLNKWS